MAEQSGTCPRCGKSVAHDPAAHGLVFCPSCGCALEPAETPGGFAEADPLIGQTLGEFEIVSLLGKGGMGAVYKARQPSLRRFVALKVLPQWLSREAKFVERFHREAHAAAAISHPSIVQVHAIAQDKGWQYIAMELIEGASLADLLKREGRLPPARVLGIMKEVASALAEGHRLGILHRDVKPANILLDATGRAKVVDFGLARQAGVDVTVTTTGQSIGTPLYLPPDVARSGKADARSDLYSLGATFYQALAGRPPFDGVTPAELILKHDQDPVPPLRSVAPDAPPALCRIIHRLLQKDPAQRYQSAEDLLEALREAEGSMPAAADRAAPRHASMAYMRTHWRGIAVFASLGAAAGLILAVVLDGGLLPRPPAPPAPARKPTAGSYEVYTGWPFDPAEARRRQKATAEALGVDVEQSVDLGNGVKMTFVLIPAGEFLMGSPPTTSPEQLEELYGKDEYLDYKGDFPQHRVRISRPFWLGKTPVTQQQWQAVSDDNPSEFPGRDQNPVEKVSWEDCQQFFERVRVKTTKALRLPTEAEWEYACRAGAATAFHFGDSLADLDAHAWHGGNAAGTTHPVGKKKPNAWGLYDMAGNVWQWCGDWHSRYRPGTETDPKESYPTGWRPFRGGCWLDEHSGCLLSAHRCCNIPSHRSRCVGFRAARAIGSPP